MLRTLPTTIRQIWVRVSCSFIMEKQYWVKENPTGEETGHYTSIINPKYKYVGCGDFYSKVGRFSNTLATELSEKEGLDESMLRAKKDVMQKIEVAGPVHKRVHNRGR